MKLFLYKFELLKQGQYIVVSREDKIEFDSMIVGEHEVLLFEYFFAITWGFVGFPAIEGVRGQVSLDNGNFCVGSKVVIKGVDGLFHKATIPYKKHIFVIADLLTERFDTVLLVFVVDGLRYIGAVSSDFRVESSAELAQLVLALPEFTWVFG